MCPVEFTVGTLGPYWSCASICASSSSERKLAFQYCWRPGGSSASNRPLSAGYGIGATYSATTGATSWRGLRILSPSSIGPAQQATKARNGSPRPAAPSDGCGGALCQAG